MAQVANRGGVTVRTAKGERRGRVGCPGKKMGEQKRGEAALVLKKTKKGNRGGSDHVTGVKGPGGAKGKDLGTRVQKNKLYLHLRGGGPFKIGPGGLSEKRGIH